MRDIITDVFIILDVDVHFNLLSASTFSIFLTRTNSASFYAHFDTILEKDYRMTGKENNKVTLTFYYRDTCAEYKSSKKLFDFQSHMVHLSNKK